VAEFCGRGTKPRLDQGGTVAAAVCRRGDSSSTSKTRRAREWMAGPPPDGEISIVGWCSTFMLARLQAGYKVCGSWRGPVRVVDTGVDAFGQGPAGNTTLVERSGLIFGRRRLT